MAPKTRTRPTKKAKAKTTATKSRGIRSPDRAGAATATRVGTVARAMPQVDDDDKLMAYGAGGGAGFGRCGGRLLGSRLEQVLCDRLSNAGVAHSHAPRHFEVRLEEKKVGAYAPMVVLRGRGREGKSVVIEATEQDDARILQKIVAFRAQYGQEFYVILVAAEDVLGSVPLAAYDESCSTGSVHALISRLSE